MAFASILHMVAGEYIMLWVHTAGNIHCAHFDFNRLGKNLPSYALNAVCLFFGILSEKKKNDDETVPFGRKKTMR